MEKKGKKRYMYHLAFSQAFNRGNNVGWIAITAEDGTSISDLKEGTVTEL